MKLHFLTPIFYRIIAIVAKGTILIARLEDLKKNAQVRGISPTGPVTILNVDWHGSDVLEVTYRDMAGHDRSELKNSP